MKREKTLKRHFGEDEFGFVAIPDKVSGTTISRVIYGDAMGCSYCFPHGFETINSHRRNNQRSWKKHRRYRWK